MPNSKKEKKIKKLAEHAIADIDKALKIKKELHKVLNIRESDLLHAKKDLKCILKDRFDKT